MMYELSMHVDKIEAYKFQIAKRWATNEILLRIFNNKNMDLNLFENKYSVGVIEYFIGVLLSEEMLVKAIEKIFNLK